MEKLTFGKEINLFFKIISENKFSIVILLFLLFLAFIFITICSKSSPLYPFNDWVDANCFFTVGKSIVNGKTLYLDIFEKHKSTHGWIFNAQKTRI